MLIGLVSTDSVRVLFLIPATPSRHHGHRRVADTVRPHLRLAPIQLDTGKMHPAAQTGKACCQGWAPCSPASGLG